MLPGIILALIGAHLAFVWFQKHTQFPGPGRTEHNVVGVRVMPVFAVKSGAFFALTTGVLGLMGGLLQINPIWNLGPYKPSQVSAGMPTRLLHDVAGRPGPALAGMGVLHRPSHRPRVVWVALIMGLIFTLLIIYPFLEKRFSGDYGHHNLLQRPRDVPVRTSIGAMAIAFYMVLTLSSINDIIAYKFHISLNATTWIGRIGMIVLPPIIYFITYRWCVGLQRSDRAVLEHGIETGIIKRLPHGAYIELHQPLGPVDDRPPRAAGIPRRPGTGQDEQARLRRLPRLRQLPVRRPGLRRRRAVRGRSHRRTTGPHRTAGTLTISRNAPAGRRASWRSGPLTNARAAGAAAGTGSRGLPPERPRPRSNRPGCNASSSPNSSTVASAVRWPICTAPEPSRIVEVSAAVKASSIAGEVPATPGLRWCSANQ